MKFSKKCTKVNFQFEKTVSEHNKSALGNIKLEEIVFIKRKTGGNWRLGKMWWNVKDKVAKDPLKRKWEETCKGYQN